MKLDQQFGKNVIRLILVIVSSVSTFYSSAQIIRLNQDWAFHQVGSNLWYNAEVPGTVHTDLLRHELIQDPFYRDNELKVQWVSKTAWEYKTYFLVKKGKEANPIYLRFKGLDTYADVYLNGELMLQADNMFRNYTCKINQFIKSEQNELKIIFHPSEAKVDSIAKSVLPLMRPCENNRHYVRKAQYNFGWDWAPKIITCGIWRDIELIFGEIADESTTAQYSQVELKQESDSIGQSFYFIKDGKPLYMKGANWVPADVFLPRITKSKYRSLLIAAKEANINMLRVWGGGIYEDDYFYELCDSLEIYIWQDFMFAGAMYPADSLSLENIKAEAIDNILRLRRHSCIVLWCGNNEISEAWNNWGWQTQFKMNLSDSLFLWKEYDTIFNKLLPTLVHQYDSARAYIASSPLYGWGRSESMLSGDSHYWGLWWGLEPISVLKKKIPRFMSEFGMQAMPDMKTISQFATKSDFDTSSIVMKLHQKHPTGFKTLASYLEMEKLYPKNFNEFVQMTQELQSRVIETGISEQINSKGRCMGSLWWQFNDCWPVCNWSVIDFYGRKKKGYYTMKSMFLPQK